MTLLLKNQFSPPIPSSCRNDIPLLTAFAFGHFRTTKFYVQDFNVFPSHLILPLTSLIVCFACFLNVCHFFAYLCCCYFSMSRLISCWISLLEPTSMVPTAMICLRFVCVWVCGLGQFYHTQIVFIFASPQRVSFRLCLANTPGLPWWRYVWHD